jgi:hypothetical protein
MKINISHSLPAVTLEDIQKFESRNNIKLPKQYQEFLLNHNGGLPDRIAFDYYDYENGFWDGNNVIGFFGLSETKESLINGIIIQSLRDNIFDGMLPIARTSTADLICINVAGEDAGDIYIWKHSYDITIRIAEDFDSFIDSLFSPEDPESE